MRHSRSMGKWTCLANNLMTIKIGYLRLLKLKSSNAKPEPTQQPALDANQCQTKEMFEFDR